MPTIKSCIELQSVKDPQLRRVKELMCGPKTELYLFCSSATLSHFVPPNTFLQQEKVILHKVHPALSELFKKLLSRFLIQMSLVNSQMYWTQN